MPEKPEVITVANSLKKHLLERKIIKVDVLFANIILKDTPEVFSSKIVNQTIHNITTRGKWIVFSLDTDYLFVHLRMEGKFLYRGKNDPKSVHEHVIFTLDNDIELRYMDTRKFGKMIVLKKEDAFKTPPISELGYEFDDTLLTSTYLMECFNRKTMPIKTALLDQHIIAGIGNIYDDEILYRSHISPFKKANSLTKEELEDIIKNTKIVLEKAIKLGGTTIRSYSSEEGVSGKFQNELQVHGKNSCPVCKTLLIKTRINGRGTFYCPTCQK
ncbi:MAG: DNA-formamidopyrimidine glycosylase [Bacilli bacterium]